MAYDIGPKIGIDGEAEFRKTITTISTNIKTLGTEMDVVTSAYGKNDRSAASLTAQNEVLTRQIAAQREKLDQLSSGLAASAEKFGENDEKTLKWQASVNTATAQLNRMEQQLSENNTELESQGGAFDKLKSKMSTFGSGLGSVMKVAGTAMAAFATAATAAAGAVGKMVYEAAYAADDINTLAKQTGLSTDEIQKFQFASEQIDVSLDTLTGSMAKMTKNMATASKGTGDAYTAFQALGVEITNQDGTLRDRNDVFNEAIDALGRMENETQRDAYAMQIFGKSAQDLNPLILGGADALEELGAQAEAAGVVLSQDSLDKLNLVSDAIDTFKATASGAGNLFSTGFAEPIAQAVNTVTGYIQRLTSAFSEGGMDGVAQEMGNVMSDLVGTLNTYLPMVIQFGSDVITSLVTGLVSMLPDIALTAVTVITQLVDSLSNSLPQLIPVAVDAILTIVDTLLDNIDQLVSAAIDITLALAEGLIDALPLLIEKAPVIVTKLVTALVEAAPKLLTAAWELITSLVTGIVDNLPEIGKAAVDIIATLVTGVANLVTNIREVGANIVTGVFEGIQEKFQWLKDKVTGFFTGIVDGVKDFLGIQSPSKVFAGIGEYMAQGLGRGFTGAMASISRDIDAAIPVPTIETTATGTVSNAMSGIASALSGMGYPTGDLNIRLVVSGREFAVATLPDFRAVEAEAPIIVDDF